jgi:hypothetical protein
VQIDQISELAQRATDTLVLEPQSVDLGPMCGGNEGKQVAFLRVDVITKATLELRPYFTDVHWIASLQGARQLRQELIECAVFVEQAALDPARLPWMWDVRLHVGHDH